MTRVAGVAVAWAVLGSALFFSGAASAAPAHQELSDTQLDVVAAGIADAKAVGDAAADGALVQSGSVVRAYTRSDTTAGAVASGQVTAVAVGSADGLATATSTLSLAARLS
jgi:hypothetical protein